MLGKITYIVLTILKFTYFPLLAILFYFTNKERFSRLRISIIVLVSCLVLGYQVTDYVNEKREDQRRYNQAKYERAIHSQKLDEVEKNITEKEKKGTATVGDYLHYVVSELQNIRFRLSRGKDLGEYITGYFSQVSEIPDYYNENEWFETEKIIYESTNQRIQGHFSSRGLLNSGGTKLYFDAFNKERQKLLKAKERVFGK